LIPTRHFAKGPSFFLRIEIRAARLGKPHGRADGHCLQSSAEPLFNDQG
jgi:hypothetical protein